MIVGIDLGTSTSEIAIYRNGAPRVLREVRGSDNGRLPSVVGINQQGQLVVGRPAESQLILRPELTVQEVKRRMGTADRVRLGMEEYSPQEISAFILRHLKEEAERLTGFDVCDAVISVPAYFNDRQRQATIEAGELAGLNVVRIVNEPTAAALAYGVQRPGAEETVLVYDLGGGTLDVTLIELSEGILDVLASTGNVQLGGKDFDERLMKALAKQCLAEFDINLFDDARRRVKLKEASKRAKEDLSDAADVQVVMDNLLGPTNRVVDFAPTVTRHAFETLVRDLLESTKAQIDEALAAKGYVASQVTRVLPVGGSTKMPMVHRFLREMFPGKIVEQEIDSQEAVVLGAAILAGIMSGEVSGDSIVITDVMAFSLGVAVARLDDEPATKADVFSPIILRNSTVPRTETKRFFTSYDGQDAVRISVFQGDNPSCAANLFLVEHMHPMEPAPAGAAVDITFKYNLNGVVEMRATDVQTRKGTSLTVYPSRRRMDSTAQSDARRRIEQAWRGAGRTTPEAVPTPSPEPAARDAWSRSLLYPRVAALLKHAEARTGRLEGASRTRLEALIADAKRALEANSESEVIRIEAALTDFLFDLS
jgi:molecular chaperone DnaK